jgi:integrase
VIDPLVGEAAGTKAVCAAIRPGLTFHGLRHSHKTWLIAGGAPEIARPAGSGITWTTG